ncbi:MAG: YccF domain-containing protein [Paludibacteraceae bacterium]
MKTIGNILWLIFGGFIAAIEYVVASMGMMLTIVGIPFGLQSLKLALLMLLPFGAVIIEKPHQPGCVSFAMNVIWFFIGGVWIWLTHILLGVLFAITIIGIPFAKQHFKFAKLAFTPFGKDIQLGY